MKHCHEQRIALHRESGAVLIVGLVMVLLISIIALSAIRNSNLQEAMVGNMRDRNIAFQAAESALVEGEQQVGVFAPDPTCTSTGQPTCYLRLEQPAADSVIYLSNTAFEAMDRDSALVLASVRTPPTYMIEELTKFKPAEGSGLEMGGGGSLTELVPYRVSAKGSGLGTNSTVIVQSTYNRFAFSE